MSEPITREDIPKSVDTLIEFWSQSGVIERASPEPIQSDILNYLEWVKILLAENELLRGRIEG